MCEAKKPQKHGDVFRSVHKIYFLRVKEKSEAVGIEETWAAPELQTRTQDESRPGARAQRSREPAVPRTFYAGARGCPQELH